MDYKLHTYFLAVKNQFSPLSDGELKKELNCWDWLLDESDNMMDDETFKTVKDIYAHYCTGKQRDARKNFVKESPGILLEKRLNGLLVDSENSDKEGSDNESSGNSDDESSDNENLNVDKTVEKKKLKLFQGLVIRAILYSFKNGIFESYYDKSAYTYKGDESCDYIANNASTLEKGLEQQIIKKFTRQKIDDMSIFCPEEDEDIMLYFSVRTYVI